METVDFWEITFRSAQHLGWFIKTLVVFTVTVGWFFVNSIFIRKSITPSLSWLLMVLVHIVASLVSVVATRFGTVNGSEYSVDCIWFNALVALVYLILWWLIYMKFTKEETRIKIIGFLKEL